MRYFVTGGAGFIGSNLCDLLLKKNHQVSIYDNFSTGKKKFIDKALTSPNCNLVEADLLDINTLNQAISNHDIVVHLAANADVRFGSEENVHPLNIKTFSFSFFVKSLTCM